MENNNFFTNSESKIYDEDFTQNTSFYEPSRRLNDYDYNILKEDAYKEINDELFKLEYKISKIEEDLKHILG